MPQQPFPLQQVTSSLQIYIQDADDGGEIAEEYYLNHYQRTPLPESSSLYRAVDSEVACQNRNQITNIGHEPSATNYPPSPQAYTGPLVFSFTPPPPPSPIKIPTPNSTSAELSPLSSLSTSPSTSSSAGPVSPEVCRQSRPIFDEQTRQWSCGGCSKPFSDKYGAERHIDSVGRKVTCRYCGGRVSALDFSRRRHFGRESCRKKGLQRGFVDRNEEDAFIEDP